MAKVLINSLIDEINLLLSRPVGSLSRKASPDVIQYREQLKQLRSHLENLADDSYIGNLRKQYSDLVNRLSNYGDIKQNISIDDAQSFNVETKVIAMDNQPANSMDNIFNADADLVMETSTMTNASNDSTFINDRVLASLQQVIQQSLQQVVKDSVQQVVSQTLAVERALMVGEISANLSQSINQSLTKIVEAEQRSQINQELITLNQQKQKLSAEIAQLEADRSRWMQQFQEFQNAQQESLDRSLQTVNNYVREQITDTVQQTVQQKIQAQAQTEISQEVALANKVQEQTNQFLAQLDEMFNSTFRSLEQDMQGYQGAIAAKIGYMESLEQRGEELISALVDQIQQNQSQLGEPAQRSANFPELPDDIPVQYLETVPEPADENLINALLAGNQFGEAIVVSEMETEMEVHQSADTPAETNSSSSDVADIANSDIANELSSFSDEFLDQETAIAPNPLAENLVEPTLIRAINDDVTQLESILGAPSDSLFEDSAIVTTSGLDAADFDIGAETQLFVDTELGDISQSEASELLVEEPNLAVPDSVAEPIDNLQEDPELLNWLEESSNRDQPTNIGEISADAELMSWLGNDALDMAKLPTKPSNEQRDNLPEPLAIANQDLEQQISQIATQPTNKSDLASAKDSPATPSMGESEPLLYEFMSDRADESDESIILLTNEVQEDTEANWADNLFEELNSDLASLDRRKESDLEIAANLDQFIRNTPYSQSNWEENELDLNYPTIVEVSAYPSESPEVPPIIENPDALFEQSDVDLSEDLSAALSQPHPMSSQNISEVDEHPIDDVDSIFAEVIADNAARHSQPNPFQDNDTSLDTLLFGFDPTAEVTGQDLQINPYVDTFMQNLSTQSDQERESADQEQSGENLDTFMQGTDELYLDLDSEADTIRNSDLLDADLGSETLDTILQGDSQGDDTFNGLDQNTLEQLEPSDLDQDITSFLAMEDLETVLDDSVSMGSDRQEPESKQDDWSIALEELEAKLAQPVVEPIAPSQETILDLSADEFFASLEYEKLNDFADNPAFNHPAEAEVADELDADDLLLNQFADFQDRVESEQPPQNPHQQDSDWELLINELESFNLKEPLIDAHRQQLGLSAVAPITDTLDNVLDIDSLVIDTRRDALIPPTPAQEVYSLDDVWILGIDFGNTCIRTSLLNVNTGKVYPLLFDDAEELPCQVVWRSHVTMNDPIEAEMRVIHKKNKNLELENGEVLISHFKQLLKVGLPYRGVSAWQPIVQWTEQHQLSLRWLIAALKNILEQIQTRAAHPRLPDLGLILLKLNSVVFGYPAHWSDTYVLNVREAILKAGLVKQEEQVLAVEQAIAPVLDLLHHHAFANQMTLLVESGALTTSFCLVKGTVDDVTKLDRSKLQVLSLDYAGHTLSQDIVIQLFAPHWQLITNPHRQLFHLDHLQLPEVSDPAPHLRCILQQYLLSSEVGRQMLELADRVKNAFSLDGALDTWNEEIMGQPLLVMRRELENLIFQPFIKRLNRELNSLLSNMGILSEDIQKVLLLGNTMSYPSMVRWLTQKLPDAAIETLQPKAIANGLAVAPLYPHLYDVARQQYSDYFLLLEICRLNLTKSISSKQLLEMLQKQGVNIKSCRDRILSILQGDLPDGIFPWQEPEQAIVMEDPTLSSDLFAGRLFELETDGTYQPNVAKFYQLRIYLQAIISNLSQSLSDPLVFPEILSKS
ncbi:MAG: hypothetical protein NW214_02190 [Pseudanabaenaceae cyanobacterium bins.39]|nr:hypothetical protein [Pseudanabaenaceae cyanobacterium bins.39]